MRPQSKMYFFGSVRGPTTKLFIPHVKSQNDLFKTLIMSVSSCETVCLSFAISHEIKNETKQNKKRTKPPHETQPGSAPSSL